MLLIHQLFVSGDQAGGTRHAELARHLVADGHRVTVIADRASYLTGKQHAHRDDGLTDGVIVHRLSGIGGGSGFVGRVARFASFTAAAFVRGLTIRDVDVVYGTTPPLPQAATAMAAARLRGVPFLLEVRDLWPDFAVELGVLRNPTAIEAARRLERALYAAADVVVANSPGFVSHLEANGARRIEVIPNGVDPDAFDPRADGSAFRREHGLEGKVVFSYTGAHGVPNDLSTVLSAADALRHRDDIRFLFVGDGRDKARLVAESEALRLPNVRFVPPQPKSRMGEVLAATDVGLATLQPLPLFRTVYPNKVFDYMAAGLPTLLTIDGVVRTAVEESDAGRFAKPGDPAALAASVVRYADDPELRSRQGRAARRAAETRFRRSDHARALARLLGRLTGADA